MSIIPAKYFSFFTFNNISLLKQLLYNYITIGEKELIRSSLSQLYLYNNNECLLFIKDLLFNGLPSQYISFKDKNHIYIMWMLLQEYLLLEPLKENRESNKIKEKLLQVELDLLIIYSIDNISITPLLLELYQYIREYYYYILSIIYNTTNNNNNDSISFIFNDNILEQLYILIELLPDITFNILDMIIISDILSYNTHISYNFIINNQNKILLIILKSIQQSLEQKQSKYIKYLQLIPNIISLSEDILFIIDSIINTILSIILPKKYKQSLEYSLKDKQKEFYNAILSCSNTDFIHRFIKLQDIYYINTYCNTNGERLHSNIYIQSNTESELYLNYYHYIRIKQKHIFKYIMESSIELIKEGKFFALKKQLKHFKVLGPLLLVYYWRYLLDNISDLIQLIDICYTKPLSYHENNGLVYISSFPMDSSIINTCCLLLYQVSISKWCAKKLWIYAQQSTLDIDSKYLEDINIISGDLTQNYLYFLSSRILKDLINYSLLYVLEQSFDILDIDIKEIINLLSISDSDTPNTIEFKQKSLLEILSYCILSKVLQFRDINLTNTNYTKTKQYLLNIANDIKELFTSTIHIQLQLSLLEFLIGFLFISKKEDLSYNIKTQYNEYLILDCILTLLDDLLYPLQSINDNLDINTIKHIKILDNILQECKWRLNLFTNDIKDNILLPTSLFSLWKSSNECILIYCLKKQSYSICKDIINYYNMHNNNTNIVIKSELIHQIINNCNDWKSKLEHIDNTSLNGLLSWFDIITQVINNDIILYMIPIIEKSINNIDCSNYIKDILNNMISSFKSIIIYTPYKSIISQSFHIKSDNLIPTQDDINITNQFWDIYNIINNQSSIISNKEYSLIKEYIDLYKQLYNINNNVFYEGLLMLYDIISIFLNNTCNNISLDFINKSPDILISKFIYNNDFISANKLSKMFNRNLIIGLISNIQREINNNNNNESIILTQQISDYIKDKDIFIYHFINIFKYPIDKFPVKILNNILEFAYKQDNIIQYWFISIIIPYFYFAYCYLNNNISNINILYSDKTFRFPLDIQDIILNEESKNVFNILSNECFFISSDIQNIYYNKLIESLIQQKKYDIALYIIDEYIENGVSDDLLLIFIKNNPKTSWKYILRLKDKKKACSITFTHLEYWDIIYCLDILDILYEYSINDNTLPYNQIFELKKELLIYKELQNILNKSWNINNNTKGWKYIADYCKNNTNNVIQELTDDKYFDLARKISLLFSSNISIKRKIEQEFIIAQMESIKVSEYSSIITPLLLRLNNESIHIAECIIYSLSSNIPYISLNNNNNSNSTNIIEIFKEQVDNFINIQLFIIQYIIRYYNDNKYLEQYTLNDLLNKQNGLKLLQEISIDLVSGYLHLSSFPELIIEGLILAEQTIQVNKIFLKYPQYRDNTMILYYCSKSMQLSNNSKTDYKPTVSHSSFRQIRRDFIAVRHSEDTTRSLKKLTVNNEYLQQLYELKSPFTGSKQDEQVREDFIYTTAPNIRLFKALISLCKEYKLAGEKCIELANLLSIEALPKSSDPLFITDQIQQIILTAKYLLLEARLSADICDRMLSHLTLIQAIIIRQCNIFYSLLDFNDIEKMNQLRDRLIKEDHIQLALDVCLKCHLDPSSVWASWGLSLLRMGDYTNAKDKFLKCLKEKKELSKPNIDRRKRIRSSSIINESANQVRLVNDIVKILEIKPRKDSKIRRQEQRDSIRKRMIKIQENTNINTNINKISSNNTLNKSNVNPKELNQLDTERYMQAIFYLIRFGSEEDTISFWVRHGYYEDALRFILQKKLSSKLYIEVAMRVIHSRGTTYLFSILKRIDPSFENKEYLLRFCAVLSSSKAEQILLETQIFMGDNIRAGLTCVSKAKKTVNNILLQVSHLDMAHKCLFTALDTDECQSLNSPLTESEVMELGKTVKLQLDAVNTLIRLYPQKIPPDIAKLSILSGDVHDIEILSETLISLNQFAVGYPIIQEYSHIVKKQEIYKKAAISIAKTKRYTTLVEILRLFRSTGTSQEEIDEIVSECAKIFFSLGDTKNSDKLISKISSLDYRVNTNISCGKLEKAFIESTQNNRPDLVKNIQNIAQKKSKSVYKMCQKYFHN